MAKKTEMDKLDDKVKDERKNKEKSVLSKLNFKLKSTRYTGLVKIKDDIIKWSYIDFTDGKRDVVVLYDDIKKEIKDVGKKSNIFNIIGMMIIEIWEEKGEILDNLIKVLTKRKRKNEK